MIGAIEIMSKQPAPKKPGPKPKPPEPDRDIGDWDAWPVFLTTQQAADLLGVHLNTLKNKLIRLPDFPARKVGRNWRISRDGLREWVEKGGE